MKKVGTILIILMLGTTIFASSIGIRLGGAPLFAGGNKEIAADSSQVSVTDQMSIYQNSFGMETRRSEKIQANLNTVQPQPNMEWSLERENIIKRTELWNDENKIAYIYLYTRGGQMAGFFTIKGKVSSINSALSAPEQIVKDPEAYGEGRQSLVVSSPQEDGSYGTNGDAIFFFTTDGAYVEWSGDYLVIDRPLKVNVPVTVTMEREY